MIFFALFDPVELTLVLDENMDWGPDAGYAAGFFFFWFLSLICAGLTAFLVRTAPKRDAAHRAADEQQE